MMNDMKRTMRLLRYGDQYKMYMVLGMIWFVLGVLMVSVCAGGEMASVPCMYLVFAPMNILQSFASLEAVGMVKSSSKRKFLFIAAQDLLGLAGTAAMLVAALIIITIKYMLFPDMREIAGGMIVCVGLSIAMIQIYMPIVNKSFIGGVAVFGILFYVYFVGTNDVILESWKPSYGTGLLLGIAMCILGAVAGHIIRICLYKKPISKFSLGGEMRKYM